MVTINKVLAIIQARYDSNRLPGKVLELINNKPILEIIIKRLSRCKNISKIIVACSISKNDIKIINLCKKLRIKYFAGSENDVVERFYKAAKKFKSLNILRITADCPLIDYEVVDKIIENFFLRKVDYASNINPPTFPDGFDAEIFTFDVLKRVYKEAKHKEDREHIRPFILKNVKFKKFNLTSKKNYSLIRLTVDETEDLKVIRNIFNNFKKNFFFLYKDIVKLYKKKNYLFLENKNILRNEGINLNIGQKMWRRANKIIPGGTMLFSKNPDLFLPNFWPAYFEKTRGCYVWDLEKKKYIDLSMMGVGTNILGYSRREVDNAVKNIIRKGNMCSLNSKEDILLSERLIEIHPWAQMVRLARTGAEANNIALRIAKAATGREKIALCGYHGWHDWYLAANFSNSKNLDRHFLKSAPTKGISKSLKNSIFVFDYNNFNQLQKIIDQNRLAAVIMEVSRSVPPRLNFLENIRKITKKNNIILIFDECTSGFRENYGGLHLKYDVTPDIATFGKALGNGYAINAVIGRDEAMKHANSTFISSTFWTDRIGPAAALATLDVMKKIKSWDILVKKGKKIKEIWKKCFKQNKIEADIRGLDALPEFNIKSSNSQEIKTYISQEFLKKNFLCSNRIYLSTTHNDEIVEKYFNILNSILNNISKSRLSSFNYDIKNKLDGPVCISGLRQS